MNRNLDSPPRRYGRNSGGGGAGGGGGSGGSSSYRRYSRSRSRSRERSRDRNYRRHNSRSRSRERYPQHHHQQQQQQHYGHGGGGGSGGGGGGGGGGGTGSQMNDQDLYRDIINDDYKEDQRNSYNNSSRGYDNRNHRHHHGGGGRNDDSDFYDEDQRRCGRGGRDQRDYDRDQRDYDRNDRRERDYRRHGSAGSSGGNNRRYNSDDSDDSDDTEFDYSAKQRGPFNTIIVFGLNKHITEADISSLLIQANMSPISIRLIRKKKTGASRGFAFVEFETVDEAAQWMELTQGVLQLDGQTASLQYSMCPKLKSIANDWYCVKCGINNFKRRFYCFKCRTSRVESEKGEGNDEISNFLTKKIMLRNLDVLTNEEGVLTALQQLLPELAKKINTLMISRDVLTQTSRGICYLCFENLIDSMNVHNSLTTLEPPLQIDNREISVNYCVDSENRKLDTIREHMTATTSSMSSGAGAAAIAAGAAMSGGNLNDLRNVIPGFNAVTLPTSTASSNASNYTLADVPRLAEYSASLYATTPAEHAHYLQYYTEYYVTEINKGEYGNLPTGVPLTEANSGAAVALSAIQRQQKKMNNIETTATAAATAAAAKAAAAAHAAKTGIVTPKGNDGKVYPPPDVSLYQYDESSGYYYDPTTGLYYDAHSQYYYNNETGAYLYWDQRKSTYILATAASAQAAVNDALAKGSEVNADAKGNDEESKKDKSKDGKGHDKVKVAKKIVKDMEKWAKQLNQKKDYTVVATPQPILPGKGDMESASTSRASLPSSSISSATGGGVGGGYGSGSYADIGFSILEKKERVKLTDFMTPAATSSSSSAIVGNSLRSGGGGGVSKLVNSYGGSDSEEEQHPTASTSSSAAASRFNEPCEKDFVDLQKLTCLLCKRVFQSLEILQKHLKMSNLHKENLAKLKGGGYTEAEQAALGGNYRDRAKERRLKYGESDPPPPNRSRERFENEIKSLTARQPAEPPVQPISSSNVGSRLLQKMGWSEGQGLGRKNQGRTQIIETEGRFSNAGLGTKSGMAPGDDYKTYMKKMMKARYESV